jgi:hypothetical protein
MPAAAGEEARGGGGSGGDRVDKEQGSAQRARQWQFSWQSRSFMTTLHAGHSYGCVVKHGIPAAQCVIVRPWLVVLSVPPPSPSPTAPASLEPATEPAAPTPAALSPGRTGAHGRDTARTSDAMFRMWQARDWSAASHGLAMTTVHCTSDAIYNGLQ